jgi:hypothetical protein
MPLAGLENINLLDNLTYWQKRAGKTQDESKPYLTFLSKETTSPLSATSEPISKTMLLLSSRQRGMLGYTITLFQHPRSMCWWTYLITFRIQLALGTLSSTLVPK